MTIFYLEKRKEKTKKGKVSVRSASHLLNQRFIKSLRKDNGSVAKHFHAKSAVKRELVLTGLFGNTAEEFAQLCSRYDIQSVFAIHNFVGKQSCYIVI